MKDKIFMRFFNLKWDEIPVDSKPVINLDSVFAEVEIKDESDCVLAWLKSHPNGKVDFVVL